MRRWFRNRSEKRLDQELHFHFEEQVAEYVAAGLSAEEARRKTRLEFGHLDEVKEECRDVRVLAWIDELRRDVRFALRMFARSPGFTAVCLVTLALGIGANGAVFSVMNELVLTQPPFRDPDRLISIDEEVVDREHFLAIRGARYFPFYPLRDTFHTISEIGILDDESLDLRQGDKAETVRVGKVSSNLLDVLGIATERGRWISAGESREVANVVVVSHALWTRRFSEDPNLIGRTIRLADYRGEDTYLVIGILPRFVETAFPLGGFDLFLPYDVSRLEAATNSAEETIARLSVGATRQDALNELVARQVSLYPEKNHHNGGWRILVRSLNEEKIWYVRSGLWLLAGAVGFVLLIACTNLAGMFLTRGAERKHEMTIRTGLGASGRTIISQIFVEIGLISLCGGALALFTAWIAIRGLQSIRFALLPNLSGVALDWRAFTCCFVLTLATALVIGALPAWIASRSDALGILRQTASTARSGERRIRDVLVATQIALSVVLVVGAGLLLHSMGRLLAVDPGYDSTNVISLSLSDRGKDDANLVWRRIIDRIRSLPGVDYVAAADYGPPMQVGMMIQYRLPGDQVGNPAERSVVNSRSVSQDYFSLLGIRFLAGGNFSRALESIDTEVVVSRSFAESLWPQASAIGQRISVNFSREPVDAEIVGVVDDVRQLSLREKPEPMLYRKGGHLYQELLVKTSGEPAAMVDPIKQAIWQIDPTQPFRKVNTIEQRVANQNAELRFYMYLLSEFAGLALLLAVVGLYSVAAQAAVQRTQEIGLRMAVGASRSQILMMVARQGLALAGLGIVVGMAASYALSKYLESWLYEITPTDPLTFGAAALLLALVAWIATVIPARRAARLDPMKALRYE